jgi:hypothetical protein
MIPVMKKIVLMVLGGMIGLSVQAQAKKSSNAPAPVTAKPSADAVTPISFETSLAYGTITLNKIFRQGEGKEFVTIYTLSKKGDASFNNSKPLSISLSRKSFDSVFTHASAELAGKYAALNKYVSDNKISLTDENGWISLIKHYNNAYY